MTIFFRLICAFIGQYKFSELKIFFNLKNTVCITVEQIHKYIMLFCRKIVSDFSATTAWTPELIFLPGGGRVGGRGRIFFFLKQL